MLNLERIKSEKCQTPLLRRPPPFIKFSDYPPSGGGNQNLLPPFRVKGGGGGGGVRTIMLRCKQKNSISIHK